MADIPSNFLLDPTPHEEAAAWIKDKPVVSREVFNAMVPELRARAFLVTGIEDANVAGEVRDIIAKLPAGQSWEKTKKELVAKLGPWLSADDPEKKAAKARAELMLRTHGFQAYQVAQHRVMREQEDVLPYWQYLTLDDEKVRPGHAALNLKVAPANAPFWHDHSPPWQWGCRCRKVALLEDEVEEMQAEDAKLPPERQRVFSKAGLALAEQGRIYNRAGQQLDIKSDRQKGKTDGYVFDPDALTLPLSSLQGRYDAVTWGEFEAGMKASKLDDGRSVWGWLNGEAVPATKPGKPTAQVKTAAPVKPVEAAKGEPGKGKLDLSDLDHVKDREVAPVLPHVEHVTRPAESIQAPSRAEPTARGVEAGKPVAAVKPAKTASSVRPYMNQMEIEDLATEQVNRMSTDEIKTAALGLAEERKLAKVTRDAVSRSRGKGEARSLAIQARMKAIRVEMEAAQRDLAARGKTSTLPEPDDSDLVKVPQI